MANPPDTPTTYTSVKEEISRLGLTLTKRDNEYRVNFRGGREVTAYYTTDLFDAYGTACKMAETKPQEPPTIVDIALANSRQAGWLVMANNMEDLLNKHEQSILTSPKAHTQYNKGRADAVVEIRIRLRMLVHSVRSTPKEGTQYNG